MPESDSELTILPGTPGRLLAAAVPLAAVGLIVMAAARDGSSSAADEPVPPQFVAALTLVVALILAWRALTQFAVLDEGQLVCRNVLSTFRVRWDDVEELRVVRRPGLVMIEVRVHGLRRRQRLGAATRPVGPEAEEVLSRLRSHPHAAALVADEAP